MTSKAERQPNLILKTDNSNLPQPTADS